MKEIDDKDAAKLVSMIYRPEIEDDLSSACGNNSQCKVGNLVNTIEVKLKKESSSDTYGGEMTKEEYQDVINQIKSSPTLMDMEIANFKDNPSTQFRAMTLVDPKNQIKPVVVFRGTAGDYQWADNFAAEISSRTPSQQEAQEYVVQSGYDHLTVVGHSKGGNMAASMAYLLPEGMVDKVYSIDGQGESKLFLDNIPEDRQEYAKEHVFNINEYRDIVSQLMKKTGDDKNTTYFDSGVDFKDTDYKHGNLKMYIFHPHKPNYFLTKDVKDMGRTFVPSRLAHELSKQNLSALPKAQAIWTAKKLAGMVMEGDGTEWDADLWSTVYDAENIYQTVNKERNQAIMAKLSQLYHLDFSNYVLNQAEGSFVVEGAVLTCRFCSGIGTLGQIEDHGLIIQDKTAASVKDNVAERNILIGNNQCSVINYAGEKPEAESGPCHPVILHEWVITDSDKQVTVAGEKVNAVLKKSALGCLYGGMITVAYNGQMDQGDAVKNTVWKKVKKGVVKERQVLVGNVKDKNPVQMGKDIFDLIADGYGVIKNAAGNRTVQEEVKPDGRDMIDGIKQLGSKAVHVIEQGCDDVTDGVKQGYRDVVDGVKQGYRDVVDSVKQYGEGWMNQIEKAKDQYIDELINQQLGRYMH